MKVKVGVGRMIDPDVLQLTNNIIAGATGKAELAKSPVTLAQLGTLVTDAETALSDESQVVDTLATSRTDRAGKFAVLRQAVTRFADQLGARSSASVGAANTQMAMTKLRGARRSSEMPR